MGSSDILNFAFIVRNSKTFLGHLAMPLWQELIKLRTLAFNVTVMSPHLSSHSPRIDGVPAVYIILHELISKACNKHLRQCRINEDLGNGPGEQPSALNMQTRKQKSRA